MIPVLYQDTQVVAVNKPAGTLVHRTKIDPRETNIALQQVRDQLGIHVYPVHRLDKPTSGVLLFGLDKETAQRLATAFAERRVAKTYIAVVRGYLPPEGEIDYPLKEIHDKKTDRKARQEKPAQAATTHYQTLATVELPHPVGRYDTARYSLAKLLPRTGRKHQLRRHLKHIFHPILGDRKYGDWRHNQFAATHFTCNRLLLHAASLRFNHPVSGQAIVVHAALPADFEALIQAMGFNAMRTLE